MRATVAKSIALSMAALTLSLGMAATPTPAAAHPHWAHPGFFAAAIGLGVLGAIAASEYAGDPCVQYRPTYDRWGNYIGRRAVNVCQ